MQRFQVTLKEGEVGDHTQCFKTIEELTEQVRQLQEENKVSQDRLSACKRSQIETTEVDPETKKHCYTDNMIKSVYACQEHHVGSAHISFVIKAVLENMTGMSCTSLPSRSTIQGWNITRLALAQRQLAEEFSSKKNTTLCSDETSKYGAKVIGYHATDKDKNYWVLGLRDICSKSADDTLITFKQLLDDVNKAASNDASDAGKKLLSNIQNTMSDRAATELKWHEFLALYRTDIARHR